MELLGLSKLNEMLLNGKLKFEIEIDKMEISKTTVSVDGIQVGGIHNLILDATEGLKIELFVKEDNKYGNHVLRFKPYYPIESDKDAENAV